MKPGKNPFATIGAGIVIIKNKKVLLVQMNYGEYKGHWQLPGGMLEIDENPEEAAVREAYEETGARTKTKGLIAVRHRILKSGLQDIYFVFLGVLTKVFKLKKDAISSGELQSIEWMEIQKALQNPFVRPLTKEWIRRASKPGSIKNTKYKFNIEKDMIYLAN